MLSRGRALFAASPLDDPRLDITAIREVDQVTAGLRITGTGRDPQVEVFSDPPLGQTDALAYLVTGGPLSDIGNAAGDAGERMQNAAQSLGTAAGGLLAERLGKRLGIDEIGIVESEEVDGAAFTVGEYLSPRLYLGYGVGLFEPGQIVTLRYALSDDIQIEAVSGEERTRASIEYRVER
jgi:translocation and assembly module TamB